MARTMAGTNISVAQLSCSICLNLLTDPVTLTCGHSYCTSCITGCWDQDDQKRVYSCPQCRQTFTPRPVLDVECDVCTGEKNKAIKSCLVCLNSYCQSHFECHEELHPGKRHKVTDVAGQLQEMICTQHEKLKEIFFRTDQCCICYLCMLDEHKKHDTVSAGAERTKKQTQLDEIQIKFQKRIQERETELEELRESVESYKRSAQTAVEDTERIFTELIRSIERRRSEVTQLIRDQEKSAVSQAEEQLKRLEQEIEDLRRRDAELEHFSHTENHIHFLQSFQSLSVSPGSTDSPSITVSSCFSFNDVGKSVSHLREKLEHFCREEIEKIHGKAKYIDINPNPEFKTRDEFLQYFFQFTVDSNTVHKNLHLSKGNRVITYTFRDQLYPDHSDRFDTKEQALCEESVCGRSYWEVEWSGRVEMSVSYRSISRKDNEKDKNEEDDNNYDTCEFGRNDQSWSLFCSDSSCSFWHNNKGTKLPEVSRSSRIGVYVDHGAGTLSFYSVSDTMTLIHRVHTTFIQPLYPGFMNYYDSVVKLCEISKY
ncbi:tripartite motif-containing protein 16-like isoform X2 [Carassius auratus]|uniref:Tripartite motif-containing protein 16-like isoform X2 n=1 Tax=Carassius auratus TaxID=7957 RepID=A0A6P6PK76_CARAU|nr:tripartite motif-containing protein 16-like isoform X2 [Carassius auratus]